MPSPAAAGAASLFAGFATGGLSALIPAAAQVLSEPPTPVTSGSGTYNPEGIVVGSKVVGSGSASTSLPRLNTTSPEMPLSFGNASTGTPAWVIPALIGAAVLSLLLLLFTGKRRK